MTNKLRLSFTQLKMYTECGKKYFYHYRKKLRNKNFHSALAFGSAIDKSLNSLLWDKDLSKANAEFDKIWSFQYINDVYTYLPNALDLVYSDADLDEDLLNSEDVIKLNCWLQEAAISTPWETYLFDIKDRKKEVGYKYLTKTERLFFNYVNWLSLRQKGLVMLKSYNEKIIPRIRRTIAVQHENKMVSDSGDEIIQYLDMILEWEDGSVVLFDNKTSAREYEADSAGKSQQLISYYYQAKDEFKLDSVGFIVLRKNLFKNKTKVCSVCGHDGTGSRARTCDVGEKKDRCNGAWNETITPECQIQIIINKPTPIAEELVLSTFGEAALGIKREHWYTNLSACKQGPIICPYMNKCWNNDESELVDLSNDVDIKKNL